MANPNQIQLLIREIDPTTKNGRYLRENLKRIQNFLNGNRDGTLVQGDTTTVVVDASNSQISAANVYDAQVCTSNGQTVFNLVQTPLDGSKVTMTINGEEFTNGTYYTVVGNVLTFNAVAAGFTLEVSNEFGVPDRLVFEYTKA